MTKRWHADQAKRVDRLSGRAGQRQRLRRLRAEPLCRRCKEMGLITASSVPDHIKPLALGGTDDDTNIRCLCRPCHLIVTAEQFGQREPIGARGVAASGRPTSPDHAWNAARTRDRKGG